MRQDALIMSCALKAAVNASRFCPRVRLLAVWSPFAQVAQAPGREVAVRKVSQQYFCRHTENICRTAPSAQSSGSCLCTSRCPLPTNGQTHVVQLSVPCSGQRPSIMDSGTPATSEPHQVWLPATWVARQAAGPGSCCVTAGSQPSCGLYATALRVRSSACG